MNSEGTCPTGLEPIRLKNSELSTFPDPPQPTSSFTTLQPSFTENRKEMPREKEQNVADKGWETSGF